MWGFMLFVYVWAGVWLAEHKPLIDSRSVRLLCWLFPSKRTFPRVDYGPCKTVWRKGRLHYDFSEQADADPLWYMRHAL